MRSALRFCSIAAALLLAACQTVAVPSGLTAAQTGALHDNGFVQTDQGWELGMSDRLLFQVDESRVVPDQAARIGHIAGSLGSVGITRLRVEGYTDSTGSTGYNDELSVRRATSVAEVLATNGLPRAGISVAGRGESDPVENNGTARGRAENRRVVIIVPVE